MVVHNWNRDLGEEETTKILINFKKSTIERAEEVISSVKDYTNEFKYGNLSHFVEIALGQLIEKEAKK